uniref:Uncharacterized protein n=1 Tax=Fagus sylvatica TaxID=28930 RepID=A0A2N9HUN3_FAGSY
MDLSQYSSIQSQVDNIKEKMFSKADPYSFISPSAYDTAWLAMIPDPHQPSQPMFKNCLDWVLNNQKEEGFWGECDAHGMPTIECLPATLACIVALKKWNVGTIFVEKGMEFIHANTKKLLGETKNHCPRWFAIIFPGMVELAHTVGVELVFSNRENLVDKYQNPPLLSYLEALPAYYDIDQDDIIKHLSNDGSLFQSPSATASAFMVTGNKKSMAYLLSLVQRCDNGVPPTYPMDEEIIKLCMMNQLLGLGLAEHFVKETEEVLAQAYKDYLNQESKAKPSDSVAAQLFKDSLAFRLLRMHGYDVSSDSFCWFLHHEDIRNQIQNDHEYFSSAMLNVYRATDLMFSGEYDIQQARSFSKKLLKKITSMGTRDQSHVTLSNLQRVIFSLRLSYRNNCELVSLAKQNYEFRQSIYKYELEELKRWSKDLGLTDMGFGREKTTYCYFAVATSSTLPCDSNIRMIVAKSAIVITVADDFFDMEGSLSELKGLTNAIQRWNGKGLSGHSKIIFDALDNLVSEIAAKYLQQEGRDITKSLQDIWYETFVSWLTESKWSKTGYIPSTDEYLETGMTSIATHTIVLPASCFLKPSLPNSKLKPGQYENITKLLMVIARLLNDIQSYQKEKDEGKMNFVLLYLKDNPEAEIEEAIACTREILDKKKKDLLKHVLIDEFSDLPKPSKHLHLSCMKVFQMFFNSSNGYDSNTEMLEDIKKAIYIPLEVGTSKPLEPLEVGTSKPPLKPLEIGTSKPFYFWSKEEISNNQLSIQSAIQNIQWEIFWCRTFKKSWTWENVYTAKS